MSIYKPQLAALTPAAMLRMSISRLAQAAEWSESMMKNLSLLGAGEQGRKKVRWDNSEKVKEYNLRVKEWFAALAEEVTLGDVFRVLEEEYAQMKANEYGLRHKNHLQKICELGFTRLDSIALPQESLNPTILQALGRERLLALDGRLLGSIGEKAMNDYRLAGEEKTGTTPPPFTVRELLANSLDCYGLSRQTIVATWTLLKGLGFAAGDGAFMAEAELLAAAAVKPRRERVKRKRSSTPAAAGNRRGATRGRKKRLPPSLAPEVESHHLVAELLRQGEVSPEIAAALVAKALEIHGGGRKVPLPAPPVLEDPAPIASLEAGRKRRCFSKPTTRSRTNICGVAKIVKRIKGVEFQYYVAMIYSETASQRKKHFSVRKHGEAQAKALAKKQRKDWELEFYGPESSSC